MCKKTAFVKKVILAATAAFCFAFPAAADYNKFNLPDSTEIRRVVKDSWLASSLDEIRNRNIEARVNEAGVKFQIRLEEGVDDFAVIIAPQSLLNVDLIGKDNSSQKVQMEVYPSGAPGSWVLYRNKDTGKPTKICMFFNQDAEVYIQFQPSENKTFADMIVFNSYAARSVPVGISFESLYTMSFADVYKITAQCLPWQKVAVVPKQYHAPLQMAAVIRENLSRIDYADDACYNERGKLYSISTGKPFKIIAEDDGTSYDDLVQKKEIEDNRLTLSTAGFLKWIIDGLVEPRLGTKLSIGDLLQPTVEYYTAGKNGVLSQKWNLSFTLDWSRNLAAKALSARSSKNYNFTDGGVDVTVEPFSSEIVNGKLVNTTGYIKDSGYSVAKLKSILYVLAVTEPSYCYLGAIRQSSKLVHDEMVFNECAIFFPYFDDTGRFGCTVFENGRELTLEKFCGTYSDSFVHLERVKCDDSFFPQ